MGINHSLLSEGLYTIVMAKSLNMVAEGVSVSAIP
jgi:hypothetical protein